jgi:hypothetical protein
MTEFIIHAPTVENLIDAKIIPVHGSELRVCEICNENLIVGPKALKAARDAGCKILFRCMSHLDLNTNDDVQVVI